MERAEVPIGPVYATDAAISKKVKVVGTFHARSHPSIVYPVAAIFTFSTTSITGSSQAVHRHLL